MKPRVPIIPRAEKFLQEEGLIEDKKGAQNGVTLFILNLATVVALSS